MPEKDPTTYSVITYLWVIGLSALGGLTAFIRKVRSGNARAFNIAELVGELVTSAFAGIMTFYLCEAGGISPLLTAAFVGIASHMGTRAVFAFERVFEQRMGLREPLISMADETKENHETK